MTASSLATNVGPPLIGQRLGAVVERGLARRASSTARRPASPCGEPRGEDLAVVHDRAAPVCRARAPVPHDGRRSPEPSTGTRTSAVSSARYTRSRPGRAAPTTTPPGRGRRDRGIRAPQPHIAVLGVDDRPRVARRGDRRARRCRPTSSGSRPRTSDAADVVAQHRAVGARVAEQDAALIDRDGVGGVLRGVLVVGREGVELRRLAAGEPAHEDRARSRCGRRRSRRRWRRRSCRPASRARRAAPRSSRSAGSASSIRVSLLKLSQKRYAPSAVCATWLGVADAADRVELADRGVHAGVPAAVAGLQRPDRRCRPRASPARPAPATRRSPRRRARPRPPLRRARDRAAPHQSTPVARSAVERCRRPATTTADAAGDEPRQRTASGPRRARRTRCPRRARDRPPRRRARVLRRSSRSMRMRAGPRSAGVGEVDRAGCRRPLVVAAISSGVGERPSSACTPRSASANSRADAARARRGSRLIARGEDRLQGRRHIGARDRRCSVARAMRRRSCSLVFWPRSRRSKGLWPASSE